MEGIIRTLPRDMDELKRQEEEKYWRHLRQADNDRCSREAILRHLQPYIETERLRQQQQKVQQLQQQYRLQQQLLSQQQKRLAEELEWIRLHQQKQAAAVRRQQQQQQQLKKKEVVLTEKMTKVRYALWNPQYQNEGQAALAVEQHQQHTSNWFTPSEDHERAIERHLQPQQSYAQQDQQRQRQTEVEHQQSREQAELDERQRVERDEIWQLYKLRKQQEQQLVEERQWRYQLQQQQQATLSDKFQQHVSETLLQYEPPSRKAPEPMEPGPSLVQESNKAPQFIQTFVSSTPQSWSQALTADHVESQVADEDEDDEASDREGHPRQYYNSQHTQSQQYDWRELRRISKVYTPMPRRKRGRKGRGDLFEDDYHAGFNKIEIQSLSTAGKAAYESQRQRRQQHDAPALDLE